jgi:hypothetical protein
MPYGHRRLAVSLVFLTLGIICACGAAVDSQNGSCAKGDVMPCGDGGAMPDATRSDASHRDAGAGGRQRDASAPTDVYGEADVPQPTSLCDDAGWCWVNAWPVGADLYGLWQDAPDDVWAVGDNIILHFDGTEWKIAGPPVTPGLQSVSGTSSSDVWALGAGVMLHWNGTSWTEIDDLLPDSGPTSSFFSSVFAIATDDVWVAGFSGVAHWDGTVWSAVPIPGTLDPLYAQVWASGPSDVWITLLSANQVANWNGTTWTVLTVGPATGGIGPIWGTGPSDVYVAGENGTFHYDGSTWSSFGSFPGFMWGSGGSLWVAGDQSSVQAQGVVSVWNGATWTEPAFPSTFALEAISGSSSTDIWVAGGDGALVHWDGSIWSTNWKGGAASFIPMTPVCRSGTYRNANDAWIVGNMTNGSTSSFVPFASHWDGTSWTPSIIGDAAGLADIWSAGPNDTYASGEIDSESPAGVLVHWDGSDWSILGSSDKLSDCTAIWADSTDDVWACCGNGVLHWDGKLATPIRFGDEVLYTGIWGSSATDVYVAGGGVKHFDGKSWSDLSIPTGAEWVSGSGPNDVWISGDSYLFHWDGAAWSNQADIPALNGGQIVRVVASAPNTAWLSYLPSDIPPVPSALMLWDGTSWSLQPQPQVPGIRGWPGTGVLLFSDSVDSCGFMHHF